MSFNQNKRTFLKQSVGIGLGASVLGLNNLPYALAKAPSATNKPKAPNLGATKTEAMAISSDAHHNLMDVPGLRMMGNEQIVMLVYPKMTMLDLVGPQYFFASMMGAKVHLLTLGSIDQPIMGDTGFAIMPTITLDQVPDNIDLFFIPGGTSGTSALMQNEDNMRAVKTLAQKSRLLSSVCTGSMVLAHAGLLTGKRATSHWLTREILASYGVTPVDARVVEDGNVITGAGVSAGIDFALSLLAKLRGEPYAKAVQLQAEYAPQPPFVGGTPETTDAVLYRNLHQIFAPAVFEFNALAQQA
mgnify:CR=1 FL=1